MKQIRLNEAGIVNLNKLGIPCDELGTMRLSDEDYKRFLEVNAIQEQSRYNGAPDMLVDEEYIIYGIVL